MPRTLFENSKLTRDSVLTWIFAFSYPVLILAVACAFGGARYWATILSASSLMLLYTVPLTIRYMRTNIIRITEDFGQLEVEIKTLTGKKQVSGMKREFRFVLNRDAWNKGRSWYINIYCRGELAAKQFHIGLHRSRWVDDIAAALSAAGLDVTYV